MEDNASTITSTVTEGGRGVPEQVVAAQPDGGENSVNPEHDGQEQAVAAQENNEQKQAREINRAAKMARLAAEKQVSRRYNDAISALGMRHPDTGKAISSLEELQALQVDLEAKRSGVPKEELLRKKAEEKEIANLRAENLRLKRSENDRRLADDLSRIREAYPECQAQSPMDLGLEFVRMMAAGKGNLDPVMVYGVISAKQKAAQKPVPPGLGGLAAGKAGGGEYYSEAELDALTPAQLRDNRIYEKAMKSYDRLLKQKK